MKKKILALAITVFTILSLLCSCNSYKPQHFFPVYSFDDVEAFESVYEIEGNEPSEEVRQHIQGIFSVLRDNYAIVEKELPTIKVLTEKQANELWGTTEEGGCRALYDNGVLYLVDSNEEGVIAHELCHYLSDNTSLGMYYQIDDILVGRYLNEGVTNYFSTQYFQYDQYYVTYEFETHVAKLLSIIYGEDNLRNAFFSGDVSKLREDFNSVMEKYYGVCHVSDTDINLTPFDAMACCLDTYTYAYLEMMTCAMSGIINEDLKTLTLVEAQTVEEMLVLYAKEKGVEKEVKKEILAFLDTTIIPFNFEKLF